VRSIITHSGEYRELNKSIHQLRNEIYLAEGKIPGDENTYRPSVRYPVMIKIRKEFRHIEDIE